MTSTLCVRQTPTLDDHEFSFSQPVKGLIARKFYDHDGSLGGGLMTVGLEHLPWFEELLANGDFKEDDKTKLRLIIGAMRLGRTIDMWFEV